MTLDGLGRQDGWHVDGRAARVHYRGDGARYSVEFYEPSNAVLYWRVPAEGETAVPVAREDVPTPLRERIREDLEAAGVDPAAERQSL